MNDNAAINDAIGTVNATDADGGHFGVIQYAIINTDIDYFAIDPITVCHLDWKFVTYRFEIGKNIYESDRFSNSLKQFSDSALVETFRICQVEILNVWSPMWRIVMLITIQEKKRKLALFYIIISRLILTATAEMKLAFCFYAVVIWQKHVNIVIIDGI